MRKRTVTELIALLGMLGLMAGCGGKQTVAAPEAPQTAETVTAAAPATEESVITADEEMLAKYLAGIRDRNVLEGSRDINYLSEAASVKRVITDIEVDDREVDTSKAGTYTVRYKITVNLNNLEKAEAYIREHPDTATRKAVPADASKKKKEQGTALTEAPVESTEKAQTEEAEAGQEMQADTPEGGAVKEAPAEDPEQGGQESQEGETASKAQEDAEEPEGGEPLEEMLPDIPESVFDESEGDSAPGETTEIIVEKEVKIVTPDEAEEIIKEGGEVWTDGSRPVQIEDLGKPEDAEAGGTATAEAAAPEKREEADVPDEARDPDDDPDDDGGQKEGHHSGSDQNSTEEERHSHDWVEQTKTVHHDEKGHFEDVRTGTRTVVDEEAWDEPVYETKAVCSACGYEADSTSEINDHLDSHYDPELGYSDASYSSKRVQVDTIHHPAQTHEEPMYEQEWVVDSEAWDEVVVTGYRCRSCGAEK